MVKLSKIYTRGALYSAFFGLVLTVLVSCSSSNETLHIAGNTMGTTYHVTIVNPGLNQQSVEPEAEQLLQALNQQMSTYIESSELSALNRAELGVWLPVSRELFEVLELSQVIAGESGGAFDVTLGPVVNLWGFGPDSTDNKVPSTEQIEALLSKTGMNTYELDSTQSTVRKLKPIYIDLSAIAKGYAADKLANMLTAKGYQNYLIEIGGELRVSGKSSRDLPWRLAIEQPTLIPGEVFQAMAVSNGGIATSGDYRNFFEVEGIRYSHTIDPDTGSPVNHQLASVTVIAQTAAAADAWATALNVLGTCKGLALAEQLKLPAYFISNKNGDFVAQYSQAFSPYLD